MPCASCVGVVLCENCIVDANIDMALCLLVVGVVLCFLSLFFDFLFLVLCACCVFVLRAHGGCLGMLSR